MAGEDGFELTFKTLTGDILKVTATGSMTVKELTVRVAEEKGCSSDNIKLMYGRKFLKNENESLANYGIDKPCKLKAIIRMNQVIPTTEIIEGVVLVGRIWCIDISPDNKITAVGFSAGEMRLYNTVTGDLTFSDDRHGSSNLNVKFSKDGGYLISGNTNYCIHMWNHDGNGSLEHLRKVEGYSSGIWTIDVSKDNTKFLLGGPRDTEVFDLDTAEKITTVPSTPHMNCSRFSNNGQFVACVGWAGKFVVYDIENNEYMHNKTAHQAKNIWIVAVSKNDELLFTGGFDKKITQWDVGSGDEIRSWTFDDDIYGLYMLKNDEFILGLQGNQGKGFLVKIDDDVAKEKPMVFCTGKRTLKIAGSTFSNAFMAYSEHQNLKFHKFTEEEFFGCV